MSVSAVCAVRGFIYITPIQVAEIFVGMRENEELSTKEFLESFIPISFDYRIFGSNAKTRSELWELDVF